MIKMTLLLEVIRNRLDAAEGDINDLEDITVGSIQNEAKKKKYCKRNDHNLTDLWGKHPIIYI